MKMSGNSSAAHGNQEIVTNDPILPNFGVAIGCEKPTLQLCRPKLLPLKTYSYMKMQLQMNNKINQPSTKSNDLS